MMHKEIGRIEEGHSDIDRYGATNEAEFLQWFLNTFEKPDQLQAKHPELYDLLSKTFGQDPANH